MQFKVFKANAFTDSINGGNPAGVVFNTPEKLTDEHMKSVSKILNVSETVFFYPSNKADYKTRFFSPEVEVDLCGHATIASFFTLASEKLIPIKESIILTQETKSGFLPVEIFLDNKSNVKKVMMTQGRPVFKAVSWKKNIIADCLDISSSMILDDFPKEKVSTGLFTLPICLESLDSMRNIKPDFEKIKKTCVRLGVGSFHVFTFETIESCSIYHARNFAPAYGILEDPVTGTANGAVCSYLLHHELVDKSELICEQGDIINRPGRVNVEISDNIVKIGGRAKITGKKSIEI